MKRNGIIYYLCLFAYVLMVISNKKKKITKLFFEFEFNLNYTFKIDLLQIVDHRHSTSTSTSIT